MNTISLAGIGAAIAARAAALPSPTGRIENHTFDEMNIGDGAHLSRTLQAEDIQIFAAMSGDVNPAHVDPEFARHTQFHGVIAHGMWGAALISTVIGTEFPGPGTIYMGQTLRFERPVHVGDTLSVQVAVTAMDPSNHHVSLDCRCTNQHGAAVITGNALVLAPTEKISRPRMAMPALHLVDKSLRYRQLLGLTVGQEPIMVAVVHPCSDDTLRGAVEAAQMGLIVPILIGPLDRLREVAAHALLDISSYRLVDAPNSAAAAAIAVSMARRNEVQALMKGSLPVQTLLTQVLAPEGGLGTGRCLSHVHVLDVPSHAKPLLISDAVVQVEPDLAAKRDIVRNAIDLAHALGIARPCVAILAAIETVDPHMRSTLDAAALCKMAERGQITGGIVDGPLAIDNAISPQAPLSAGLGSPVAGHADILIAPDLEVASMLVKQLVSLADAQVAGLLVGATVPVILNNPADGAVSRTASCALAILMVKARAGAQTNATAPAATVSTASTTLTPTPS